MSNGIEKIKQETGIQDLETLDQDKLNKIMDAANSKKINAEDIKELIKMFPSEFLGAMGLAAQGIKISLDQASSAQMENLKGTTATQMQVIHYVADSLRTTEETIRLLATQAQSDSFRSEVVKVLMELGKYKSEIPKILQSINQDNNQNRLEMQKENNKFFTGIATGILGFASLAIWVASGAKTPPPKV